MPAPIPPQNPSRFDAVFFDLGNTLIYFNGWREKVRRTSAEALVNYLKKETLCNIDYGKFAGALAERIERYYQERENELVEYNTECLLQTLLSEFGCQQIEDSHVFAALSAMYSISQAFWFPEEDAEPTLKILKSLGYRLGIISNAAYSLDVQQLIQKAKLESYFEAVIISADIGLRKPHPGIFQAALERTGINPSRAVMVGDTLSADVLGARNMQMASVWITRRADPARNQAWLESVVPDHRITTLRELPILLQYWP